MVVERRRVRWCMDPVILDRVATTVVAVFLFCVLDHIERVFELASEVIDIPVAGGILLILSSVLVGLRALVALLLSLGLEAGGGKVGDGGNGVSGGRTGKAGRAASRGIGAESVISRSRRTTGKGGSASKGRFAGKGGFAGKIGSPGKSRTSEDGLDTGTRANSRYSRDRLAYVGLTANGVLTGWSKLATTIGGFTVGRGASRSGRADRGVGITDERKASKVSRNSRDGRAGPGGGRSAGGPGESEDARLLLGRGRVGLLVIVVGAEIDGTLTSTGPASATGRIKDGRRDRSSRSKSSRRAAILAPTLARARARAGAREADSARDQVIRIVAAAATARRERGGGLGESDRSVRAGASI